MRENTHFLGVNMGRRANRRWLVAASYLGLGLLWFFTWKAGWSQQSTTTVLLITSVVANTLVLGGYGRWGLIKPFINCAPAGAPTPWNNDERELRGRDRMHFYAFRIIMIMVLIGYVLGDAPFRDPILSRTILLGVAVFGLTLPQALLLWTEPDLEWEASEAQ